MQTSDQLVAYARQIAIYCAYANLENELQEFAESVISGDIWHQYHEAADLLYYAACIDYQMQIQQVRALYYYDLQLVRIRENCLDREKSEKAALAKYSWRASGPGRKDEDFEIGLIRNACG